MLRRYIWIRIVETCNPSSRAVPSAWVCSIVENYFLHNLTFSQLLQCYFFRMLHRHWSYSSSGWFGNCRKRRLSKSKRMGQKYGQKFGNRSRICTNWSGKLKYVLFWTDKIRAVLKRAMRAITHAALSPSKKNQPAKKRAEKWFAKINLCATYLSKVKA